MTMQSVSGFTDLFYRTTNPPEYHCHYTFSIRMPTKSVMLQLAKGPENKWQATPKTAVRILPM